MKVLLLVLSVLAVYSCADASDETEKVLNGFSGCGESQIKYFNESIRVSLGGESDTLKRVYCVDANFDGHKDILAEYFPVGLIQATRVYLYQQASGAYEENEEISRLPCLNIDVRTQMVSGECFTTSMCERRAERYKFVDGKLQLVTVEGSYCDPASGESYKYIENYKNGKLISK